MNAAMRRRMSVWLNFDYMSVGDKIDEKEIDLIMQHTGINRQISEKIVKIGAELRKQYKMGDLPYGPSVGDLVNWAKLIADGSTTMEACKETIISLASDDPDVQELVKKIATKILERP